jgi:hypothetical protein
MGKLIEKDGFVTGGVKPIVPNLRTPYYKIQDGLWELNDVVRETGNEQLIDMLDQIREAMFEFEQVMSANMRWD